MRSAVSRNGDFIWICVQTRLTAGSPCTADRPLPYYPPTRWPFPLLTGAHRVGSGLSPYLLILRRKVHRYKREEGGDAHPRYTGTALRSHPEGIWSPASGLVWLPFCRGHSLPGRFYDRHFRRRHRRPRRHPAHFDLRESRRKNLALGEYRAWPRRKQEPEAIIYMVNGRSFNSGKSRACARCKTYRIYTMERWKEKTRNWYGVCKEKNNEF